MPTKCQLELHVEPSVLGSHTKVQIWPVNNNHIHAQHNIKHSFKYNMTHKVHSNCEETVEKHVKGVYGCTYTSIHCKGT